MGGPSSLGLTSSEKNLFNINFMMLSLGCTANLLEFFQNITFLRETGENCGKEITQSMFINFWANNCEESKMSGNIWYGT